MDRSIAYDLKIMELQDKEVSKFGVQTGEITGSVFCCSGDVMEQNSVISCNDEMERLKMTIERP